MRRRSSRSQALARTLACVPGRCAGSSRSARMCRETSQPAEREKHRKISVLHARVGVENLPRGPHLQAHVAEVLPERLRQPRPLCPSGPRSGNSASGTARKYPIEPPYPIKSSPAKMLPCIRPSNPGLSRPVVFCLEIERLAQPGVQGPHHAVGVAEDRERDRWFLRSQGRPRVRDRVPALGVTLNPPRSMKSLPTHNTRG